MKGPNQKLMIYEVLTSKNCLMTEMSPMAYTLSKRALGVNVQALHAHSSSNLRAFAYVLI